MAAFRKKPVVIEAVQLVDGQDRAVVGPLTVAVRTLEGTMQADPGDWLIRGVAGEVYPCKPEIFAATYEPA